jgi:bifunctional non-homologous end joining protein LigD
MTASLGAAPFDDEDYFFEPWWPGARTLAYSDGGRLRLQTDHLADPLSTFPELEVIGTQLLADGVVLDGTLLVLDAEGRPDAELLRRRLADPAAQGGEAAFVASDLLWVDGGSVTERPFRERHARLGEVLRDGRLCVVTRGLRGEGVTLAEAVAAMGLSAVSARCLSGAYRAGDSGDDWLRLPVIEIPALVTRPLLVLLNRLPLD